MITAHLSSYFRYVGYIPRAVNFNPITQAAEAPFLALSTIDEIYPDRPDR